MEHGCIPSEHYYGRFQVVVVTSGYGAAFRTGNHLAMGQVVVLLQGRTEFSEWYTHLLQPWVHYVPVFFDEVGSLPEEGQDGGPSYSSSRRGTSTFSASSTSPLDWGEQRLEAALRTLAANATLRETIGRNAAAIYKVSCHA